MAAVLAALLASGCATRKLVPVSPDDAISPSPEIDVAAREGDDALALRLLVRNGGTETLDLRDATALFVDANGKEIAATVRGTRIEPGAQGAIDVSLGRRGIADGMAELTVTPKAGAPWVVLIDVQKRGSGAPPWVGRAAKVTGAILLVAAVFSLCATYSNGNPCEF